MQELFDSYEKKRIAWGGIEPVSFGQFQAAPRGGTKTEEKTGFRWDAWQGQVQRHSRAEQWCKDTPGLQQTKRFGVALGFHDARLLASAWSHRMQALWELHEAGQLSSQADVDVFTASYVEPADFREFMQSGSALFQAEGRQARQTLPLL